MRPHDFSLAITAQTCAEYVVQEHGTSSPERAHELKHALAKLIGQHLAACAVEHMAIAAQEAELRKPSH